MYFSGAHVHSHRKHVLTSSCLTVHTYKCSSNLTFILGTFMRICRETPHLTEIRQKYRALDTKTKVCFIIIGNINLPYKHFSATLRIFILLTATFSSKIHTTRYCIPIATVVLQTCRNVMLYVHCLLGL